MAQRRMFSKSITNSSNFLMMPQSAQNLYFHFGMNADDDGFCEIFTIMRMTESKPDDLRILQAKHYIHIFDDKVLVIMDWKENNYIQKDRYSPSKYLEIYKKEIKELSECSGDDPKCIQNVYKMDTQVRLGKGSLGKYNSISAPKGAEADKPKKIKAIDDPSPMNLEEFVKWTNQPYKDGRPAQRHIQIIGMYADEKKINYVTKGQWTALINRYSRAARQLAPFSDDQLGVAMAKLRKADQEYLKKWTLETLAKYLEPEK